MPRIAIAECKQEVSTFNPVPSRYEDFRVVRGHAAIDHHRAVREELGGALAVFDSADNKIELAPALGASSITSGGVLAAESFDQLREDFLRALEGLGQVDAAYFSLHGAMQAANETDPEGHLLEEARSILGEHIPIVVSLDLHGILTDRMLTHSDAVVSFHTYPHVDFYATGERSAGLLLKILEGDVHPVTARIKIPVLARGDEMITSTGAVSECMSFAKEIELQKSGLSAGVMWGNPFTDVPELRTNSYVIMDGDESQASAYAIELAQRFWANHLSMKVPLVSLEESVRRAAGLVSGTVVMVDAADATSSGASGDSNAIVREAIRQGYAGRVLAPIVDSRAVERAFAAGIGATVSTTIGGSLDPSRYDPLPVEAVVRLLSDGKFRSESFGWPWDSGNSAVLQCGNVTFVVGTRPVSLFDRSWFYAHGQDPKQFDMVIVKSPHCEPHMFSDWCDLEIQVDAPGATSANVASLGHTQCSRPIWPLDEDIQFEARPEIFKRW